MFSSRSARQKEADRARQEALARQREVAVSLGNLERLAGEHARIDRDFRHLIEHSDDGKAVLASWKAWRASRSALAEAKVKHRALAAL